MAAGGGFDLKKYLGDFTECAVCLEKLKDPKILPCSHGFCFSCIENVHDTDTKKRLYPPNQIKCPTCCVQHQIPPGGLQDLPVDHRAISMLEVLKQQEKTQMEVSLEIEEIHCTVCKDQGQNCEAAMFCIPCNETLCTKCTKRHDKISNQSSHTRIKIDKFNTRKTILVHMRVG